MDERPSRPARARRGSSSRERERWRSTYAETPFDELPWFEPGPSNSVRLAVESGFLVPGSEVLDVGCGAGSNVIYLAQHGFHAKGIDPAPGAVAATRRRAAAAHVEVSAQEGDVLALPFGDGSVDALVDNGCFHTLPLRRRSRYVTEVHRVLRSGGRFVLSWVAREHAGPQGPPHRPSLAEVTAHLESRFLFVRSGFDPGHGGDYPPTYFAFLVRRTEPYPPRR